ncbi:hypothetical protein Aperf_G00000034043 [Anoplocephala perfoliata]
MSHTSENVKLYQSIQNGQPKVNGHPSSIEIEVSEPPGNLRSFTHPKKRLRAKKLSDTSTSERATCISCNGAISKPSELGDARILTRPRKFNHTPGSCFSTSSDGKIGPSSSRSLEWNAKGENISKSYSIVKTSVSCETKRPSNKREVNVSRNHIYMCQSDSSINKKSVKPKILHKENKQEENLKSGASQRDSFSKRKPGSDGTTAHLNDERKNADKNTQTDVSTRKTPGKLDDYQSRHPASRVECPNCSFSRDRIKSLSFDNSLSFGKERKAVTIQRRSLKFRNQLHKHEHVTCPNQSWNDPGLPDNVKEKALVSKTNNKSPNRSQTPKRFSISASFEDNSPAAGEKSHCSSLVSVGKGSLQTNSLERIKCSISKTRCPRGIHEIYSPDKDCTCIQIEKMASLQADPVRYEWHSIQKEVLNGKVITEFESVPALEDFIPMNPAKFSTGGQGTVAWVHLRRSLMQYALKFKARGKRSYKNWMIERREAKILQKLKHIFIVDTYHIYETDSALFMVFEYLSGGCLWSHIARIGTLPECYAIYYAACILTALNYLHERGIVYRDMKAENVVLDNLNRPKLIDFGMAKYLPSLRKQMKQDGSGESSQVLEFSKGKELMHKLQSNWDSPDFDSEIETDDPPTRYYYAAYLAPEIYEESADSSHFIDSWGLGYIILEMVLGYGIFLPIPWANTKGQHLTKGWKLQLPPDMVQKLTPDCSDLVYKMLLRKPQQRLGLREVMRHVFFSRVPWVHLPSFRGPDLSKFRNSEEFHQEHFKIDKIYTNFNKKPRFYSSKKSYFQELNRHEKQSGNEYDDVQSRKKKAIRPVKPTVSYQKSPTVKNHGNHMVSESKEGKMRQRRNNNNVPRSTFKSKKKAGLKQ